MAMIQCPECKQPVSDLAPSCPNCGVPIAPQPQVPTQVPARKTSCLTMGCAVLAGLFLIGLLVSLVTGGGSGRSSRTVDSSSGTSDSPAPVAPPPMPGTQWSYTQGEDPMSKGTTYEASVRSSNVVEFTFPYAGPQRGTLILRTHPRWGKDVIFSIERGQLPCSSYDGCSVLVRFDDGQATRFSAAGPEDNSSETLFLRDYSTFVTRMLKAKVVRISPNVYQQGTQVFEFDVSNFDQQRYRPKQK